MYGLETVLREALDNILLPLEPDEDTEEEIGEKRKLLKQQKAVGYLCQREDILAAHLVEPVNPLK